jgi:hypothetical protein
MMSNGFDPASDARFRATIELEQRHLWKQIDLLWDHNRKRREEIVKVQERSAARIEAAQGHLSREIEAIKSRINGAIYSFAVAAAGAVVILLKPKLGL